MFLYKKTKLIYYYEIFYNFFNIIFIVADYKYSNDDMLEKIIFNVTITQYVDNYLIVKCYSLLGVKEQRTNNEVEIYTNPKNDILNIGNSEKGEVKKYI